MNALDLFCGIGGVSEGLEAAGFDVVAGVDYNEDALAVYEDNHNHPAIQHDLSDVDTSVLPTTDIDYIHASPPCQGFTTAGSQDVDDPRNQLVFKALAWIREIRPEYVTLEEVTGLLSMETSEGKSVSDEIHDLLQLMGYSTYHEVLNAADYGVPQKRKRVIFFATLTGDAQDMVPKPTHTQNGLMTTLDGRRLEKWATVEEAVASFNAPTEDRYSEPRKGQQSYYLQEPDEPSYTVTGSNGMGPGLYATNDGRYRRFSPEECALFQSFYEYDLSMLNKTTKYDLVGNAVPPLLAQRIGGGIVETIEEEQNEQDNGGSTPDEL